MNFKKLFMPCLSILISYSAWSQTPENVTSELVILNVKTGEEKSILKEKRHFEAPNWSRDGKYLLINSSGLLEKIDLAGNNLGQLHPELITSVNNDHGISLDGKTLIFSKNDKGLGSRIYTIPIEGGKPELITPLYPSYWHGISPDGKFLAYCAERNDQWDVYIIPSTGGEEIRLTNSDGLDDGPEYSYDGQWIYFNSHRTGRMQVYRMKPDGSGQEQLTFDEYDNWFPHPSPDNRSIVYISYLEDQKGAHPFGKDVKLRIMDMATKEIKDLTRVFYGGQGTINVHSWSPEGNWIAYVRYHKP
ncbi:PD40 domain-containing protein [Algoriphagus sp. AK58]|uniref:TolB family protein n=1 Tax=Algoriphagus sp. AK58 TaxID=1406877 RepID=UPI00164F0726|nr:PD40 domain-containing protein [Algoriphagus sp. AK58]MBC6368903.1 transporter [Algoriphagus sp. AK58]